MGRAKGGPQPASATRFVRSREPFGKIDFRGPAQADLGAALRSLALRIPPEYHVDVQEHPMASRGFLGRQKWVQTIMIVTGPDVDVITEMLEGIKEDVARWNQTYADGGYGNN